MQDELVKRLQARDKGVFTILYDNYHEALYSVVYRMVADKRVADDLLQDVFLKIWKYISSFDPAKGTIFTWMLRIARNTCIDFLRSKEYLHIPVLYDDFNYDEIHACIFEPADTITISELHSVVRKLENKHRLVIEMVYFRGFTQDEVAVICGLPVGTVKTRCRAALIQLRAIYNRI